MFVLETNYVQYLEAQKLHNGTFIVNALTRSSRKFIQKRRSSKAILTFSSHRYTTGANLLAIWCQIFRPLLRMYLMLCTSCMSTPITCIVCPPLREA